MKFEVPSLDYAYDALEPHISAKTVQVHYEKHHQGYADKLNKSQYASSKDNVSLEEVIKTAQGGDFNNAAQVWNHSLYWQSMSPKGGGDPSESLTPTICEYFGSVEQCKKELYEAATTQFGSGWAWLVADANRNLKIVSTTDAENPLTEGIQPLLTIDVWEHAYYLDFMNERAKYVQAFLDHLLNWEFLEAQYQKLA